MEGFGFFMFLIAVTALLFLGAPACADYRCNARQFFDRQCAPEAGQ